MRMAVQGNDARLVNDLRTNRHIAGRLHDLDGVERKRCCNDVYAMQRSKIPRSATLSNTPGTKLFHAIRPQEHEAADGRPVGR